MIDLSGVDYLTYGQSEWDANASSSGFGRAREAQDGTDIHEQRFAASTILPSPNSSISCAFKSSIRFSQ
jgi:NADH-quinone oxidoreductase subunit C